MLGKKIWVALIGTCVLFYITAGVQNPPANPQSGIKRPHLDKSQWPVTDYQAPEQADAVSHAERLSRGKKFNRSKFELTPLDINDQTIVTHSETELLPDLPVSQSDAIIIGEVTDAHAYLSEDKTGVYSEFTVHVSNVLKNSIASPIAQATSIYLLREGGRVKFPSGRMHLYSISGVRMPVAGKQYVFFLKHLEETNVFSLLTGYELMEGKVSPLDELRQFGTYRGADEATFLNKVQEKISSTSQPTPQ